MKNLLFFGIMLFNLNASTQNIAAGYYSSFSICSNGTAMSWGANGFGQLGTGNINYSNVPLLVSGLTNLVEIAGGGDHSLALRTDSTVWTWGRNYYGALGNGTTVNSDSAAPVIGLSGVRAIAGGAFHSLAMKYDGTVWAWGLNNSGQLGIGNVLSSYTPVQVSGLSDVIAIAGGDDHSLALSSDSTVWAWGANDNGQLGIGATFPWYQSIPQQVSNLTRVIAVTGSGYKFSLALKADGTVWAWGNNQFGQLGNGTNSQSTIPVQVTNLNGIIAIAKDGGYAHALALKKDGTVWAWGYNGQGQLGNGNNTDTNVPIQVIGLSGILEIARGHQFSMAYKNDGTIWTWGYNAQGQLGIGNNTDSNIPVLVSGACSLMPTATHEVAMPTNMTVFPNPSSGKFQLAISDYKADPDSRIEIYNFLGRKLFQSAVVSSISDIDLSNQAKGTYLLVFSSKKGSQMIKLLKN